MSSSTEPKTLPLEVWLQILEYSSIGVHRAMSQLSSAFQQIARRRLYHTLVFGDQGFLGITQDTAYNATWCRDLRLFYNLHKNRDDWKPYVHRVYIQCLNPDDSNDDILDGDPTIVSNIGSLFTDASVSKNLEFFHTTMPYSQGTFWETNLPVCGITSMSLAMEIDQGVEYDNLSGIRNVIDEAPVLQFLELRKWSMSGDCDIDDDFNEPRTWSATHLRLLELGTITDHVCCILKMPKDLQSLTITSQLLPNSSWYHGIDYPISIQSAVDALGSVKDSLIGLDLDPGASEHWANSRLGDIHFPRPMEPYQSRAFGAFTKLQRLTAPLEMFSQSTGKMSRRDDHTFYTNFPPSLQELTLVVTSREPFNRVLDQAYFLPNNRVILGEINAKIDYLSCRANAYEKAHELFEELSQLADHKSSLPALRELHLLRDPCQWLDCLHVKQYKRQLEQAGIAVHVHDRAIEGPTQDDYQRWGSRMC